MHKRPALATTKFSRSHLPTRPDELKKVSNIVLRKRCLRMKEKFAPFRIITDGLVGSQPFLILVFPVAVQVSLSLNERYIDFTRSSYSFSSSANTNHLQQKALRHRCCLWDCSRSLNLRVNDYTRQTYALQVCSRATKSDASVRRDNI